MVAAQAAILQLLDTLVHNIFRRRRYIQHRRNLRGANRMQGKSKLAWPDGLKQTAIRTEWFEKISRLPPGLNVEKASRQLREPYGTVRRWGVLFGYAFPDRRRS